MNRLGFLVGIAFGFAIAGAGLHEYDTIHGMLLLRDIHVYLILASGVGTAMPLLWLMQRRRVKTPLGGTIELYNAKFEKKNFWVVCPSARAGPWREPVLRPPSPWPREADS